MTAFVSLHNQTDYSILDSIVDTKDLFKRAKELGQTAIAITDHGTLGAAWEALKVSKETGVKLIIGCELYFKDNISDDSKFRHIILLAKNAIGYRNLLTMTKKGFDNNDFTGKRAYSIIDWNLLQEYSEGLICLTACGNGIVSQLLMNNKSQEAEDTILKLKNIFGENLGLEIQPNNMKRNANVYNDAIDQQFLNRQLINLGKKHNIKVVPACNTHYINKEDWETHDVLLAIGSHQPIYSNFRLKYPVPDFYLKSGDEVKSFFSRNYGEEFAESLCKNTIDFANMCEFPAWIDPKYSNPSGKELPIFPVKDEIDYNEFLQWKNNQSSELQNLEEDKLYLRYKCDVNFKSRIKENDSEKLKQYYARIEEELDVLEYHGFSSYMLIVADYINWARQNGIDIGPGRGCLTADTLVLTQNGFKSLDSININDKVYSHTGKLQNVVNTFKFDVSNETLLTIKTNHSFNDITLTKDHKVFAAKAIQTKKYNRVGKNTKKSIKRFENFSKPEWIEAKNLSKNDVIYTTFPIRNDIYTPNILIGGKQISVNEDICYLIGRFVGDGWYRIYDSKINKGYNVGIAFNSKDRIGINKIKNILQSLGFESSEIKHKSKQLIQLMVYKKDLAVMFHDLLPNYKSTSNTKHLPNWFRKLPDHLLQSLINGIIDSDGSINDRISIDSTSLQLILELKEALLFLKKASSISTRKPYMRGKYQCNQSYKLRINKCNYDKLGYYSKILKIEENKENYVYDINVSEDHSYLTTNYIVHNSVGGCLIAYILGIHQADPIKYDLIFARFHNKEKSSFPDIDVDIAPSGRENVQNYLRKKYGEDHVAHVSNINTITPKVYVRDIARSCELGGSKESAIKIGNEVADCIPADIKSIDDAISKVPLFAEYIKVYPEFVKYKSICTKYRAFSTHAGGLVISARPLVGLVPLRRDKDGSLSLEYDKDKAEENGLVKMDTLGLSTLDIVSNTINIIKNNNKQISEIDYDKYDDKSYNLLSLGNTFGVFQLGTSGGTIDLCKRVKPKSIEDISTINSLARPSAKDMRNDFIATRDGKRKYSLLHPKLERSFGKTLGFGLYEESLMYLAQDIAGWSLHSADRLRKLTKEKGKNPKKAQQWKQEFVTDAVKNNVSEEIATRIWDEVVDKFQGYGFNVSHSVLYSMMSYKTAYLKAHYPLEFLLSNLMAEVKSNTPDAKTNIEVIKKEIRNLGVKILPPDLNKSDIFYKIIDDKTLLTGLDALKFVGDDAIKDIISKRPFKNFFDFMVRVDSKKVRSNTIQALTSAGCLDYFNIPRKLIYLYCSDYRKKLQIWLKKHDPSKEEFVYPWTTENNWTIPELYALEMFYLNEGFICKPPIAYGNFFKDNHKTVRDIKNSKDKAKLAPFKAILRDFFEFRVKKETSKYYGQPMVKTVLEDKNGEQISCTIFPDRWKLVQQKIKFFTKNAEFESGLALSIGGSVNIYENEIGFILDDVYDIKLPPSVPADLKAKKVNLKQSKNIEIKDIKDPNDLLEQIEDQLYDQGLIDLDEEIN